MKTCLDGNSGAVGRELLQGADLEACGKLLLDLRPLLVPVELHPLPSLGLLI